MFFPSQSSETICDIINKQVNTNFEIELVLLLGDAWFLVRSRPIENGPIIIRSDQNVTWPINQTSLSRCHWNRVTTKTHKQNFVLYEDLLPIHQ